MSLSDFIANIVRQVSRILHKFQERCQTFFEDVILDLVRYHFGLYGPFPGPRVTTRYRTFWILLWYAADLFNQCNISSLIKFSRSAVLQPGNRYHSQVI